MQAVRIHDGGDLRVEEASDPVAGPGEVLVEVRAAALNRRDILVRNPPGPAYDFPKPFVAGHDGAGVRRDTGEEVVIYPCVDWGPNDDLPGALKWLGGPARRHLCRADRSPGGEHLPQAGAALLRGGRLAAGRGHDCVPCAAPDRPARRGRDGTRARSGERRLHVRDRTRRAGGSARARHVLERPEDRTLEGARRRGRRALHGGRLRSRRARARAGRSRPRRRLGRVDLARLAARAPARWPARRVRRHRRRHGRARRALPVPQLPLDSRHSWGHRRGSSATSWRPSGRARGSL